MARPKRIINVVVSLARGMPLSIRHLRASLCAHGSPKSCSGGVVACFRPAGSADHPLILHCVHDIMTHKYSTYVSSFPCSPLAEPLTDALGFNSRFAWSPEHGSLPTNMGYCMYSRNLSLSSRLHSPFAKVANDMGRTETVHLLPTHPRSNQLRDAW